MSEKKPYYYHKLRPNYHRDNHFINIKAKTLDSMVGVIEKTKSIVLYLGDRDLAKKHIKSHFKQAKVMRIKEFERNNRAYDYKKLGLIDIDNKYKLERF